MEDDYTQKALANAKAFNLRGGAQVQHMANGSVPAVMNSQLRPDQKYFRLREIADKAGDLVAKSTPCKRGCSHCCRIAVGISYAEAYLIGVRTGRSPVAQPYVAHGLPLVRKIDENVARFSGVACTFLDTDTGDCTIYDTRPLACRLYHVVGPDASRCDVRAGRQTIHSINFQFINGAHLALTRNQAFADIREYFPPAQFVGHAETEETPCAS